MAVHAAMCRNAGRASTPARTALELWGGVECTVNRVGDTCHSQLERSGHAQRLDDLRRFAGLGISALRYPILWERTQPDGGPPQWSWSDERLALLRELGIAPIAGLLHHGSGPRHTSLVDPEFPSKFAAYAAAVANRYPALVRYTPVNEPLTTARFSGLYGVWFPHGRTPATFRAALLNQCKAIVLAMAEIRRVNPGAELVQTDDLGKTYSTAALAYQAQFNNELRWLAWDLLCGRVDRQHYLWAWLTRDCGATARELAWFSENPCRPDLLGVNYYVTSERVLDDDLEHYPAFLHGGNGRDRYVDIEAARCLATPSGGLGPLLDEAWDRYGCPIAITEVHIDSTREDQIRWLAGIWNAAEAAGDRGIAVRAVTAWALLGSYDWNCLVTRDGGYYEPGAFDLRAPVPRPTAVAGVMRDLAAGRRPAHPVLDGPGWWQRPERFMSQRPLHLHCADGHPAEAPRAAAPILITGASGMLGSAFARLCGERGLEYRQLTRQQLDIADDSLIEKALDRYQPWAVVNAAGYARIDDAETNRETCYRENTVGPCLLARSCARHGLPFVTFSSDLVFDGQQREPYVETDRIAPLNVLGRSKADAETGVLDRHPSALVVRTSALFGPWDGNDRLRKALLALRQGDPCAMANHQTLTPTYVPDLVNACLDLLVDGESGIWHLSNGDAVTWALLTLRAAELARVDARNLRPLDSGELKGMAARPAYSALGSARASLMPSLHSALNRHLPHFESAMGRH